MCNANANAQPLAKRARIEWPAADAPLQDLLSEREWAVMQPQPPGLNLCWTPVVAYVASFYSETTVSLDDVLRKVYSDGPARDDAESAVQVAEEFYNVTSEDFSWIAPEFVREWCSEARAQGWSGQEVDAFEHKFMFTIESGVESVNDHWFKAVQESIQLRFAAAGQRSDLTQACIARGDLALLLLQRLESSETRANGGCPPTHYLVVVGWHGIKGRRGGGIGLHVKDPMDGNKTMLAMLQTKVEYHRPQRVVLFNTATKDWYRPIECTLLTAAKKR